MVFRLASSTIRFKSNRARVRYTRGTGAAPKAVLTRCLLDNAAMVSVLGSNSFLVSFRR
jgi:hypothetical protein